MKFENLDEYYNYLESDNSLIIDISISNSLLELRDKIEDADLKKYCSYELFFNDYIFRDGNSNPKYHDIDRSSYPNLDLFNDDLDYIKIRAEKTVNPKYKAKYNHLLWNSEHKHRSFATLAIDNYLAFLKTVSFNYQDSLSNQSFGSYFQNLFILSQYSNFKKDEVIQFLISHLGKYIINSYTEYSLVNFIVKKGKKIDISNFNTFFEYSKCIIENKTYPELLEEYLGLQIILSQKISVPPKPFHNRLAEFYITKSEEHKGSFIVHDFYLKALVQYKKAGNKEKIEDVTVLIEKAKKNLNFELLEVENTDEEFQKIWDLFNKETDEIIDKYDSKGIYTYLILCDKIFPNAAVLYEEIRPVALDLVSVMNFDINKNVTGNKKSGIDPYSIYIQSFSINYLWMIISKGFKKGKVTLNTIIDFLKENSWYGQDFTSVNTEGQVEGFNWIELLSPSLFSFFNQIEIDIKQNKNSSIGYILPIDSLVIKFEGLLREFSKHIGAQTIEIKENATQERISFEKLLDNVKLNEIIPEDDIAFFKFLFTSDGMNLRNNVAHCFYQTKNYLASTMLLLITALLKLGNYKLNLEE
ncbi:MAG: hypothetical protein CVV25_04415 [Ignavibacteriae bacterium HGW-Ignavibacteriae-4]|jgi:hypothetical protein|nr:MAG: hypothetical protein CVV25_04415 [Ignavibacteriae bacterium HGW-Ignavibacteriae-4]